MKTISFSTQLRTKLNLAYSIQNGGSELTPRFVSGPWLIEYLQLMYSIMKSSVPLMRTASALCKKNYHDQLYTELRQYFEKHTMEEMNHDKWILEDLESIGVSTEKSISKKPIDEVAEFVGSQYYWILHWHPVTLLGYIAFLEGNPPKLETISKLKRDTGFPETVFRTLIKHSDLDVHHSNELNELLDKLPLNAELKALITKNALYSVNKFDDIYKKALIEMIKI